MIILIKNFLGEPYASAMRLALNLRYQLLPYHYSLAHLMFSTGALWMRSLFAEFPTDPKVASLTTQWLDGSLLVAPVLTQDSNSFVYLPAGAWYAFNSSKVTTGPITLSGPAQLTDIPVFVRPGSIVTLGPVVQYTDASPGGSLEVQVYGGGSAAFTLVEDDGVSMAYESGAVKRTSFVWDDARATLTWTVADASGGLANAYSDVFATLFLPTGVKQSAVKALGTSGSISF
jgi:alpha-glucosidase